MIRCLQEAHLSFKDAQKTPNTQNNPERNKPY